MTFIKNNQVKFRYKIKQGPIRGQRIKTLSDSFPAFILGGEH